MPLLAPPFDQPTNLLADLDEVIVDAIIDDPRSQQDTLGPSEMGCPRCIARHFMGIEKLPAATARTPEAVPWLPWIGTALHSQLEVVFRDRDAQLQAAGYPPRWLCETRVPVDIIDSRYISGSMDLYDQWTCTVIDWKLVGTTKMKSVKSKNHPGTIYRGQAHIYGRGMTLLGHRVKHVAIRFLPRNAISLSQGFLWTEPFDMALAEEAIANVKKLAAVVRGIEPGQYDELLLRLAADPDCFSCDEYPSLVGDPETGHHGVPAHPLFDQPTPFSRR